MHSSLIPCREFAGAHSSSSFSAVICSSNIILPLRASANNVNFKYDHKPNFEEGQRLPPSDDEFSLQKHADYNLFTFDSVHHAADNDDGHSIHSNIGSDNHLREGTQYNFLQKHTGCAPAAYTPHLREKQRLSPDNDDDDDDYGDDDDDDDGECMHSNVIAGHHLKQISREGTHKNQLRRSAREGIEHALQCMHRPYLHAKQRPHTEFSPESVADSKFLSMKDVSTLEFDDEDEEDEEQDAQDGHREFKPPPSHPLGKAFNRLDFARVYNLVALRVSLAECGSLAYHLKGHLLNWPRISNIARVEGDDMDWDTKSLLTNSKEQRVEGIEDSLLRAVYGSIAPSGPLEKRLDAAGMLSSRRFRNLESLSRPSHKAMKEMEMEREVYTTKRFPKKYHIVELEDCHDQELVLDPRLQSLGFGMKKWMGPFRLLLLDTKYAGQPASKLPMAVQMLLNECEGHRKRGPRREIVPCKLTLFYAYWSMEEILNHLLSQEESMLLPITVMGHIAVLGLGEQHISVKYLIGKVVLDKHRPKVKTVINKLEPVEDNYHPTFEVLAGNHSVVTTIIEDKIPFIVNLATVYWDSELASERQRLVKKFSKKDVVCDVFAGAGPLTLTAAKKVWRVFANDPNPEALKYLAKNVAENQLQAKIELYNLDCRVFIRKLLAFKSPVLMSQVVFSLPTSGDTILDVFKGVFDRQTWPAAKPLPTLHVYGYSDATNPDTDFYNVIVCRLRLLAEAVEVYRVKQLESGRWLICASFQLPESLAFDD